MTSKLNGKPNAGIAIYQLPEANALDVAKRVNAKMAELAKAFPKGLTYEVPFDTTRFVNASINEVFMTLIEAGILVLIVIVLFLQDWRAMLVPATTIPVTIIGAFAAMAALGFTVNTTTLFGIVLAIGIVVDDAIVIVEGVAHHIERGMTPHDAAIKAMDELFGPVIGITLVLMSVFLPAAFVPGLTGQMFAQFALVIAATAFISAINAATLKPTQCALWLRPSVPPEKRNAFFRGFNKVYGKLEDGYAWLIGGMVQRSRPHDAASPSSSPASAAGAWRACRRRSSPTRTRATCWSACSCPTAPRWSAPTRRWKRSARSPWRRRASTRSWRSPACRCSTATRMLANAGVAYVILKDWGVRLKEPNQDLRSIVTAYRSASSGRCRTAAASRWCRPPSRASAMPAASRCRSSRRTAASTTSSCRTPPTT